MIYPFNVLRVFFSLRCNFKCGYCSMMSQPKLWKGDQFQEATPSQWIDAFKRLEPTRDLIITPCNAEPPIYEGCSEIVNEGLDRFKTHLYTNLSSLSMEEVRKMTKRNNLAFYVSYHHGQIPAEEFIENAKELLAIHNVINFHAPMYPPFSEKIGEDAKLMAEHGITLDTTHEYLGMYKGEMHYSYLGGGDWIKKRLGNVLEGTPKKKVLCKTSPNHESFFSRAYTVAPDGNMYTCWRHLYNKNEDQVIGSFFDPEFEFEDKYYPCEDYGDCNICAWHKDIKDAETGEQLDNDTKVLGGTVSVCMIVRDEGEMIQDAIRSVLWADEIIVVDTGSEDDTIVKAEEAGEGKVKVFHRKWDDDFSSARNFAMSHATKDWVFTLDADERVMPTHGEAIKGMLPTIEQDVLAVKVKNLYDGVTRGVLYQLRFFRRSVGVLYIGKVHNKPQVPAGSVINKVPFEINHLGYGLDKEIMDKKHERIVRMCRRLTEERPDTIESWYHLIRALRVKQSGQVNEEAKEEMYDAIQKGLDLGEGTDSDRLNSMHVQFLSVAGWIYHAFQEHQKGIDLAKRTLNYRPDHLDAILLIGMAYTYGVDANKGEQWLQRYLNEQSQFDFETSKNMMEMEHANSRILAYNTLIEIEKWRNSQRMTNDCQV